MEAQISRDEAIPQLLEEHGCMVLSLGRRMCNSAEEAEDLVQETFLQAYRSWSQFEGRSTVKTWLYTIAMRTCQRLQRKKSGSAFADDVVGIAAADGRGHHGSARHRRRLPARRADAHGG